LSFSQPVHSIGHGQVTYAQPNGWGADKGVVIVQHVFRDRRRILSFYGHLDPPSLKLRAGQCVERGDIVGNIGNPRSPPHLHFEIRLHLPDTPGPGYWSVDPTRAGWLPPSATIWNERVEALPGIQWTHLSAASRLNPLGLIEGDVLAASGNGELLAFSAEDGRVRWRQTLPRAVSGIVLNSSNELVYLLHSRGVIEAFTLADLENRDSESLSDPLWSAELPASPISWAALPQGGIVVSTRKGLTAISGSGAELWQEDLPTRIADWAEISEALIILTEDGIWVIDEQQAVRWTDAISGQKVVASDHPFIYVEDGIYDIDLDSRSTELFFDLPSGFPSSGDLAELPGGGVLVVHLDADDKRLIAIDANGLMFWERSISELDSRAVELVTMGDEVYMLIQFTVGSSTGVDLFHVDTEDGELVRIFSGGTRSSGSNPPRITVAEDSLLIDIPGVGISSLDPRAALQAVLDQ
jgi:outer membrane protein assembly factor BamB